MRGVEYSFSLESGALCELTTDDNNLLSTYWKPATLRSTFQRMILWSEWLPGSPKTKENANQAWEAEPKPPLCSDITWAAGSSPVECKFTLSRE